MSLGTGHHTTTFLMVEQMEKIISKIKQSLILEQVPAFSQFLLKSLVLLQLLQ
jgi:hypothetical protein